MIHPGDIEIFDPEWDPALFREYVELFHTILVSFFDSGSERRDGGYQGVPSRQSLLSQKASTFIRETAW